MKEYHRRRKQGKTSKLPSRLAPKAVPSAKSQIQKFRLGREKILRPWVRVKPYVSKKIQPSTSPTTTENSENLGRDNGRGSERRSNKKSPETSRSKTTEYSSLKIITFRGGNSEDKYLQPDEPIAAVQQWLESSLETYSPYNNPANGVLDPFSAMSLIITPRTQLLLHHYCKLPLIQPSNYLTYLPKSMLDSPFHG
jgi:hypothetical protein